MSCVGEGVCRWIGEQVQMVVKVKDVCEGMCVWVRGCGQVCIYVGGWIWAAGSLDCLCGCVCLCVVVLSVHFMSGLLEFVTGFSNCCAIAERRTS